MRLFTLYFFLTFNLASAQLCEAWLEPTVVGQLQDERLDELSGLSVSAAYPERLYSVSDGGSPFFFLSDLEGEGVQAVRMGGLTDYTRDLEDLDVGPCAPDGATSCLFVGDIGGNSRTRDRVDIIVLEEVDEFPERVEPLFITTLVYPDGPQDAEGLAVHPNGDIYVLSKETPSLLGTDPAKLYRARAADWQAAPRTSFPLKLVAAIDLRALSGSGLHLFSHLATSLDLSADGSKLLILTYGDAFELALDPLTLPDTRVSSVTTTTSSRRIPLRRLRQQEAITYLSDDSFLYTTESGSGDSPLVELTCGD